MSDFLGTPHNRINFITPKLTTTALLLMGASCTNPTESATHRRNAEVLDMTDRRRKPSGADDQHLYAVNI
jgi:hypothetical protein